MSLLKKLSWEWWAASIIVFIVLGFLAGMYPSLVFAFLAWGVVVGRGLLGVSEVLLKSPRPGFDEQWKGWSQATIPVLVAVALVLTSLCILAPKALYIGIELVPEPSDSPVFLVWAIFGWCGWLLRSMGPMGFMGPLMDKGCPPLSAFMLQFAAFEKNPLAMFGLLMMWSAIFVMLVVFPWAAIPALLWWPMVMRCAFTDIFEGGIQIAHPEPVAVKVNAPSIARSAS